MAEDYEVERGDCMSSIAYEHGFFWETLWNDPGNSDLKSRRKDPNVLAEGDTVHIPDLRLKKESGTTERCHRFELKGVPAKLRLRVLEQPEPEPAKEEPGYSSHQGRDAIAEDPQQPHNVKEDRPRANVPYHLFIENQTFRGNTDADGYIEHPIPPNARAGRLVIAPGTDKETEIVLNLGQLAPVSTILGVKQRLANLAFECGDRTDEMTDGLHEAITHFEEHNGLPITGDLSEQVRDKIHKAHGS